ncbi:hypothetical protein [Streptomyces pseudovenezuelae]|uniref:Uncharacterized protein n=1 Tax=Streptomyces pseudovenezuelae TaxID=67350 RepID=A0ABT6M0C6_9ACTN|nr:hypothetical protein [Streptomyces pseudovenezuelae]MDH6222021.1 hypothetical protein [Streptomyces pseudovenezuelae]
MGRDAVCGQSLLYGISGQRITEPTADRLTGGKQPTTLLGSDPAALPPAVFQLLAQQAEHAVTASAIARSSSRPGPSWLFPGQLADQPVTAHCLTAKLRRYDLPVVALRNPPSSALQWTRRAGRGWNAYLASRT